MIDHRWPARILVVSVSLLPGIWELLIPTHRLQRRWEALFAAFVDQFRSKFHRQRAEPFRGSKVTSALSRERCVWTLIIGIWRLVSEDRLVQNSGLSPWLPYQPGYRDSTMAARVRTRNMYFCDSVWQFGGIHLSRNPYLQVSVCDIRVDCQSCQVSGGCPTKTFRDTLHTSCRAEIVESGSITVSSNLKQQQAVLGYFFHISYDEWWCNLVSSNDVSAKQ